MDKPTSDTKHYYVHASTALCVWQANNFLSYCLHSFVNDANLPTMSRIFRSRHCALSPHSITVRSPHTHPCAQIPGEMSSWWAKVVLNINWFKMLNDIKTLVYKLHNISFHIHWLHEYFCLFAVTPVFFIRKYTNHHNCKHIINIFI